MENWLSRGAKPPLPALDREFLDRLAACVGPDEMRERLADGEIELAALAARLAEDAAAGRADRLAGTAADEIAATAGNLGLTALTAAAAETRRALRRPDADPAVLATRLLALVVEALAVLRRGATGAAPADPPGEPPR